MSYFLVVLFAVFAPIYTRIQKDESTCGIPLGNQNLLEDDRVVGGYDVGYYRYPWYATLIRYNQVVCGGVLIGPRTVLTAAHCYKEFLDLSSMGYLRLESIYTVKLGVYNVCTSESSQREYQVQKVQVHELYYKRKPYYDICLLTLAADTSDYQPICLPKYALKKKPNEASVPGLGTLRYQGRMPCTVHEARLLIYDDKECHDMIYRTGNDPKQIKNAFCAGYLQGGTDTCQGDSGGPLQSMNKNGQYVLLGIVSFGFHCAVPGLLGMYTDVSQYLDWIEDKSGLDAAIVNLIYTRTPAPKPITEDCTTNGYHHKRTHRRPHRKPVRIIVYRKRRSNVKTPFD